MSPSEFESGFMLRQPSWHRLENAVLQNSPATWDEARKEAHLMWDVDTKPVHLIAGRDAVLGIPAYRRALDWQAIVRNDKLTDDPGHLLSIQKTSYKVIHNFELGEIIDTLLGLNEDVLLNDQGEELDEDPVEIEVLMSLYGGRQIVTLIRFTNALKMDWDPSKTYRYMCVISRHDGNGGLRVFFTNVRVLCANTLSWAEATDGKNTGVSIRHTSNWEDRVADVATSLAMARTESAKWLKFAEELAAFKMSMNDPDIYLKRLLPVSDDMTERKVDNVMVAREEIRQIHRGPSCEHIGFTGYGMLMATTEWNDHHREFQSVDSYISRQLLHKETLKAKGARILRQMATR